MWVSHVAGGMTARFAHAAMLGCRQFVDGGGLGGGRMFVVPSAGRALAANCFVPFVADAAQLLGACASLGGHRSAACQLCTTAV